MARGVRLVNTPRSRSSASLSRVTRWDQRLLFRRAAIAKKLRSAAHLRNGPRKLAWGVAYCVPKTPTDVLLYRGGHQGLHVGVGDRAAGDGGGADAGREPEE